MIVILPRSITPPSVEIPFYAKLFTLENRAHIHGIGSIEISVAIRDMEFNSMTT